LNIDAEKQNTYDAIVVGTGISGGWASKELSEKGLKTLVLERGRNIKHPDDYPTSTLDPWQIPNGGRPTEDGSQSDEAALECLTGSKPVKVIGEWSRITSHVSFHIRKGESLDNGEASSG